MYMCIDYGRRVYFTGSVALVNSHNVSFDRYTTPSLQKSTYVVIKKNAYFALSTRMQHIIICYKLQTFPWVDSFYLLTLQCHFLNRVIKIKDSGSFELSLSGLDMSLSVIIGK